MSGHPEGSGPKKRVKRNLELSQQRDALLFSKIFPQVVSLGANETKSQATLGSTDRFRVDVRVWSMKEHDAGVFNRFITP